MKHNVRAKYDKLWRPVALSMTGSSLNGHLRFKVKEYGRNIHNEVAARIKTEEVA